VVIIVAVIFVMIVVDGVVSAVGGPIEYWAGTFFLFF
jgi:hypothetical protein